MSFQTFLHQDPYLLEGHVFGKDIQRIEAHLAVTLDTSNTFSSIVCILRFLPPRR